MGKIFKNTSSEIEISEAMRRNLFAAAEEGLMQRGKIATAMQLIASASETFDKAGMVKEAIYLDNLITKISQSPPQMSEGNKADDKAEPNDKESENDLDLDEKDLSDLESMFEDEK